jgi:hypothetical protein
MLQFYDKTEDKKTETQKFTLADIAETGSTFGFGHYGRILRGEHCDCIALCIKFWTFVYFPPSNPTWLNWSKRLGFVDRWMDGPGSFDLASAKLACEKKKHTI